MAGPPDQNSITGVSITPENLTALRLLKERLGLSSEEEALTWSLRASLDVVRSVQEAPSGTSVEESLPGYRYLVRRSHPWRKQAALRGRRLLAGQLILSMKANGQTPEAAAETWDLPIEAVREAQAYYDAHQELIHHEAVEDRSRAEDTVTLRSR